VRRRFPVESVAEETGVDGVQRGGEETAGLGL
jgi:hypothetical protein